MSEIGLKTEDWQDKKEWRLKELQAQDAMASEYLYVTQNTGEQFARRYISKISHLFPTMRA